MDDGRLAIGNIIDALEIETPHLGRSNLKVHDKLPGNGISKLNMFSLIIQSYVLAYLPIA